MVARIISRSCDWDETATYITRNGSIVPTSNDAPESGRTLSYHLVLSWNEPVSDARITEMATKAITVLGLAEHRWIAAIHRDTDHPHVHVLAELSHPITHTTWRHYFDTAKLYRFVREYNGGPLQPVDVIHGRERQFELWSGQQSFARYVYRVVHPLLDEQDLTWQTLHARLAQAGIVLNHNDRGVWLSDASAGREISIRGSRVGAAYPSLRRRLGEWENPLPHLVIASDGYGSKLARGVLLAPWVEGDPQLVRLYEEFRASHDRRSLEISEDIARVAARCERDLSSWDRDLREAKELLACVSLQPSIRAGIRDAMVLAFREEASRRRKVRAGERKARTRHLTHFARWLRALAATGNPSGREAFAKLQVLLETEVRDTGRNRGRFMDFSPTVQEIINTPPQASGQSETTDGPYKAAFTQIKDLINKRGARFAADLDAAMAASQDLFACADSPEKNLRLGLAIAREAGVDETLLRKIEAPLAERSRDVPAEHDAGSIVSGTRAQQPAHTESTESRSDAASHDNEGNEGNEGSVHAGTRSRQTPWFYELGIDDKRLADLAHAYLDRALQDRRLAQAVNDLDRRQRERTKAILAEQHEAGDYLIAQARCDYLNRIERAHLNRLALLNARPFAEFDACAGIPHADLLTVQRLLEQRFDPTRDQIARELPRHLVRHKDRYSWKQRQEGFTQVAPDEIKIHNPEERESATCALLLAYEEFGKREGMTLNGNARFKQTMVTLAVELGIEDAILNKECVKDIEAARKRRTNKERPTSPPLDYTLPTSESALRQSLVSDTPIDIVAAAPGMKLSGQVDAVLTPIADTGYLVLDKGTKLIVATIPPEQVNEIRGRRHVSLTFDHGRFIIDTPNRAKTREDREVDNGIDL